MTSNIFYACLFTFLTPLFGPKPQPYIRAAWYNAYQINLSDQAAACRQIDGHFQKMSDLGINTVFFLVKTPDGRLFYQSKFGPRACSWDPLAYVIKKSHEKRMQLHPYLNVFAEEGDYLKQHPEFAERRQDGTLMPWVSPAVPEARQRMLTMLQEIVDRYPIDGIQLDRVRYEEYPAPDSGFNPYSVSCYRQRYGKAPKVGDPDFTDYKCGLIASFVEDAARLVKSRKPQLIFSCAVYPTPTKAVKQAAQRWNEWLKGGHLDYIYPMTYTDNLDIFQQYLAEDLAALKQSPKRTRLVMGIGAFKEKMTPDVLRAQVELCKRESLVSGVCYFNTYNLFREDFARQVRALSK